MTFLYKKLVSRWKPTRAVSHSEVAQFEANVALSRSVCGEVAISKVDIAFLRCGS